VRIAALILVAGGLLAAQPRSPFDAIVAAYRAGRVDGAMGLLEDLGPNRFPANVDAMTSTPADPWYAATVALVVAEAGMKAGTLGGQDSRAPVYTLEPGSKLVWDLVPKLEDYAERSHQTSVVDFCRTWWLWVSSWRLRTSRALAVPKDSYVRFRNAPDLLVNEAAAHESLMGPILRGGFGSPIPASMLEYASGAPAPAGTFIESVHGRFWAQSARDAEVALKHAIALKPNLAEAHLRLGRVLYQQGRHKDAQAEFVRAQALSAAANDPWTSAISGMLLGRLFEGNRQMDKAAEAYRQAVALQIPGQSPALALGTFLIRQGTEEEGWKTIQQAFATSAQNLDPWVAYPAGAFHRNAELLETLRNYVQIGPNSTTGVASFGAASKSTRPASEGTPANAGALPVPTHGSSGIHIDGVRLDIRVIGTDGPVKGLTAADFEIRDNGVLQKADLQQVSPGLNLVLVSDRSASMKQAIATITDAASLLTSSLQQGDVVSAVRFSDRIDLVALQQSFRTPLPALAPATVSRSVLRDANRGRRVSPHRRARVSVDRRADRRWRQRQLG
jgi:tetratricopeptide (TPR) repeat protein